MLIGLGVLPWVMLVLLAQAQEPPASDANLADLDNQVELLIADERPAAAVKLVLEALEDDALAQPAAVRLIALALPAARVARDEQMSSDLLVAAETIGNTLTEENDIWQLNSALTAHHLLQGRFPDAEMAGLQALPHLDSQPPERQATLLNHLGVARAQQGQLDQALEDMDRSLSILDQAGLEPQASFLMNMAGLSLHLEDFESATELSKRTLEMLEGDSDLAARTMSNLGVALIRLERPTEAEGVLEEAIAMGERIGEPSTSALGNLAYIQRERSDYELALANFRRQLSLDRASGRPDGQPVALKNIGETLMRMGDHQQAAEIFEESLAGFREVDVRIRRLELYPVMIENLEILGDYRRALELMREYKALNDEVVNVESMERIAELQSRIALERSQRELAELEQRRARDEQELATLAAERARDKLLLGALILGVMALGVIALLLVRTVRMRGKANRLLSARNDRIERQQHELEALNHQLELSSRHDELTGVGNRRALRAFVDAFDDQEAWPIPYLLLLLDLDHFKEINDRHGHEGGDDALVAFAHALSKCAGNDDLVIRWGGEEFLWLAANRDISDAVKLCVELRETLAGRRIEISGHPVDIGFSAGCIALPLDDSSPAEQLRDATRLADAAMYEAKSSGRGRLVVIRPESHWHKLPAGALDLERLAQQQVLGIQRLDLGTY